MHKRKTLRKKEVKKKVHDNYKVFFYKISEAFSFLSNTVYSNNSDL